MTRRYSFSGGYGGLGVPTWTPAVRALILVCVGAFIMQIIDQLAGGPSFTNKFGLTPALVTGSLYVWQLVTYIFLHSPGNLLHILFNMLGLWMFGSELERTWGTRQFTKFFFVCGVGAGLLMVLFSPNSQTATIGASGAIYGILLAYAVLFPNRIIYFIVFPIPAKWFVAMLGALAFFSSLSSTGNGVAHIAHLGGMLCGFIYLKGGRIFPDLRWRYDRWRRNRLRRKFEVYYNERHREDQERHRRWRN